jgi:hypothetical protein
MKQALMAAIWIAASVLAAGAQTTPDGPEFEVASVKPASKAAAPMAMMLPSNVTEAMGFRGGPGTNDPGRIDYSGVTLKMLLTRAYNWIRNAMTSLPRCRRERMRNKCD